MTEETPPESDGCSIGSLGCVFVIVCIIIGTGLGLAVKAFMMASGV